MNSKMWKVRAVCNDCKKAWTTRAKNNSGAPSQCKFCGSTNTRRKSAWSNDQSSSSENDEDEEDGGGRP